MPGGKRLGNADLGNVFSKDVVLVCIKNKIEFQEHCYSFLLLKDYLKHKVNVETSCIISLY